MIETSNPEIDVDALMHRIREEVTRRKGQDSRATAHEAGPGSALPNYPAARFQPTFHQKLDRIYDLVDLLCFHGERFVDAAYQAILLRAPDSEGLKNYLGRLQRGESKVSILGSLRYSREGRASGVKVRGLLPGSFCSVSISFPWSAA